MERIKTIVAEDHPDSLEIIVAFIERHPSFEVIATCTNGEELIDQVILDDPALIIADINMPKLSGMEAIKKCKSIKSDIKVIFITGYDEFAVEAFAESAIDYIVKPIDGARVFQALEKVKNCLELENIERNPQGTKKLKIKTNGILHLIPMEDIFYVEKQGKKCIIHLSGRRIETNENLIELSRRLDSNFFMAHRSNIVNIDKISSIVQDYETFLAYFDGIEEPAHVSKLKIKELETRILGN